MLDVPASAAQKTAEGKKVALVIVSIKTVNSFFITLKNKGEDL